MADSTDGAPDDESIDWRSPAVVVILATSLVIPMDVPYLGPVLPAIATAFGVSPARTGLVITVFAAPGIVSTVVFGVAADRVGRRRVLVPTLFLYGALGALVAVAGSFPQVLALRFLQGIFGGGVLAALALTLVGDFFDGTRRNAMMGVTTGVTAFGAAVYPSVGGALAAIGWQVPFLLYGLSVLAAAVAFVALPEPEVDRTDRVTGVAALRRAATVIPRVPATALYGTALLSATLVFGGVVAGVSFLLAEGFGLGPGPIGVILTVPLLCAALTALGNGIVARYAGAGTAIGAGILGYGVGLVATWLAPAPVFVAGALAVLGVGHGLVLPSVPAALSRRAPGETRGGVLSLRTSLLLVGQTIGPVLFTVPAVRVGYGVPLLVAGLIALFLGAVGLVALRRRAPPEPVRGRGKR